MHVASKIISNIPSGLYIVTLIYLVSIVLMLPFHEMPYEDDFAYYHTVRNFLQTGNLKISEWSSASLIFQTYWGSLFSFIFGLSFKTLHLSTVVLFYFGLASFYLTLKELRFGEQKSVCFALILLTFPSLLRYTYSFMSDVPYLSLFLIAFYLAVRAMKKDSTFLYFFSSSMAMLAFLNRQIGVALPISLLIFLIIKSIKEKQLYAKHMLAVFLPFALISSWYKSWLVLGDNQTAAQNLFIEENFNYIKTHWLPFHGVKNLRPISEFYEQVVLRASRYTLYAFSLLTPMFLLFSFPNLSHLLHNAVRKKYLLFGIPVVALFYWEIFVYSKQSHINQFMPAYLLSLYRFFFTSINWTLFWTVILIITLPVFSYFIGKWISTLHSMFFKIKKGNIIIFLAYITVLTLLAIYFIFSGVKIDGTAFIRETFFIFFIYYVFFLLIGIQLLFFKKTNNFVKYDTNQLLLFLSILFVVHLGITTLAYFFFEEYLFPLVPIMIIVIGQLLSKQKLAIKRSAIVVLILLFLTISSTKNAYDLHGIQWDAAFWTARQALADPLEIGFGDGLWIPFFFYESSFNKRLQEVGGDKKKIRQLRTWLSDPEYASRNPKIIITACSSDTFDNNLIKRFEAKSLFSEYYSCVLLNDKVLSR